VPEGDDVHHAAALLDAALRGKQLAKTDFRVPRFATTDLSGHVVVDVVARGKHILHHTDGGFTVHTHFAMDGAWHRYAPGERWRLPSHMARAVIATSDVETVGFRLAIVEVIASADEVSIVGHLGPDPLGSGWDLDEAARRMLSEPSRAIGEALIDQRNVAGWGNVYKSEMLFVRGAHPWTQVAEVDELRALLDLGRRMIVANLNRPRTTTGDTRPGARLYVYGRGGQPCRRCGTPIQRRNQGPQLTERVTFWCPTCQPA
jgi:endonuclease VIII